MRAKIQKGLINKKDNFENMFNGRPMTAQERLENAKTKRVKQTL